MKDWLKISIELDPADYERVMEQISLWPNITGIMETEPTPWIIKLEIYSEDTNKTQILPLVENIKKITGSVLIENIKYDPNNENEWKKHFKPQKIGERFVIRPSWEIYETKDNELVITIDPGSAFGTGLHETTRSVLVLLEELHKKDFNKVSNSELLDAGTGSGVLSIGAVMLGSKKVIAIDNDPEAIQVANDNFKINKVNNIAKAILKGIENEKGKYNIIVANIISEVLMTNAEHIVSLLNHKGELILSGILNKEEDKVLNKFISIKGIKLNKVLQMGEWSSIWLSFD